MASSSQERALFPGRATYSHPARIPDRSTIPNPPPFGASALSRRPEQGGASNQPQGGMRPHQQQGTGGDKEPSPLNELSEEQKEEVNEAFSLFDLDRDRHLDHHEFRVALRALGFSLSKPDLLSLLTNHGVARAQPKSQPGVKTDPPPTSHLLIPHAAFAVIAARLILARDPREEIERAFDLFDAEAKGFIDLEDLKRVARELGETGLEEEELRAMVEEFDLEGKGGVGREEFVAICLQ